jgi:hypothetical protein
VEPGELCHRSPGFFSIQQAMAHAQITTSQRYVHWARGLTDGTAHKLPIEMA